jgi:hypothetical protein
VRRVPAGWDPEEQGRSWGRGNYKKDDPSNKHIVYLYCAVQGGDIFKKKIVISKSPNPKIN